ncbi:hypothetical protein ABZ883_29700 [Streptomyces sp. NPDC046977]|uniref:hypothetical protein n=1 Tax=Streptomyces sp. NPDC046977 TaxID=3154703 RepID=UPI0033CB276B
MTPSLPAAQLGEPETLAELLGDCRKMAQHWETPATPEAPRVAPSRLHGITVPEASAHVVEGMAEYGA